MLFLFVTGIGYNAQFIEILEEYKFMKEEEHINKLLVQWFFYFPKECLKN